MFTRSRSRAIATALVAATALTAFAAPAAAQQIDRIVAFGDSYADDDNFLALAGIPPASTVVYPTGRFSGGTNYVDTLGEILQVPIDNFAIGGARADISFVAKDVDGINGLGPASRGDHAPGETVDIPSIFRQAGRAAILMSRLGSEKR